MLDKNLQENLNSWQPYHYVQNNEIKNVTIIFEGTVKLKAREKKNKKQKTLTLLHSIAF